MTLDWEIDRKRERRIQLFFISLIFLSLFFRGHALESISIIGFTAYSFFFFIRKRDISKDFFYLSWYAYYLILAISSIWALDGELFLEKMRIKSALIALPFSFLIFPKLEKREFLRLAQFLSVLSILSLLFAAFYFGTHKEEILKNMMQGQPIPVPFRSHIRYSLLLNFVLICSLYWMNEYRIVNRTRYFYLWLVLCIILFVSIQVLAVKVGMLISVLCILMFIGYKIIAKGTYIKGFFVLTILLGMTGVLANSIPTIQKKMDYFRYDIAHYRKKDAAKYSDGGRIISILEGFEVIKQYPILGVGEGSIAYYIEPDNVRNAKLPHNQFILTWAQNGIFGLLGLSFIFLSCMIGSWKSKNWMAMTYCMSMAIAASVEPMLETQLGVAIFTLPLLVLYSIKRKNQ